MAIRVEEIFYSCGDTRFASAVVFDDAIAGPRPGVLIAPTFMDRSPFEEERAARLAAMGYVGLAMDLFGTEVQPTDFDEATTAMELLNSDRVELGRRMETALAQLHGLDIVDPKRTAAIGFCFGGKAVLDLARAGSDVLGVVAFHGIFDAPDHASAARMTAKVLLLHGWDDPLAPPEAVRAISEELDRKEVDWELVAYGKTGHGFTNHARADMYEPRADARSWARFRDFAVELFGA